MVDQEKIARALQIDMVKR